MDYPKTLIQRLANSTDKLIVKLSDLLSLIKTKQDKLPTDGTSEEFLAKDGEYHKMDFKQTQSDWDQNDEAADDYIKNRPFYVKSSKYTFPDANYSVPAYTDSGMELYRISDEFQKYNDFNGFLVTAHVDGEDQSETLEIITEGDNSNSYEMRDEETGELQAVTISEVFIVLYITLPLDESGTIMVSPGVYFVNTSEEPVVILDSIECIDDLKQLDKRCIPELDYVSTTDGDQIRYKAENAQNVANNVMGRVIRVENTVNSVKTAVDNAQATANSAKTAADNAQNTAENALSVCELSIEYANKLFMWKNFSNPPFQSISSKYLLGTFQYCKNMTTCRLECASGYDGFSETQHIVGRYDPQCIDYIFAGCTKLKSINGMLNLVNIKSTSYSYAFQGCTSLTHIERIRNIKASISFLSSPLDDYTINMLLDNLVEGSQPRTITFKSDIVANLTDEQLAKLPSNWTVQ